MNLTTAEFNILATRHANSYEASQLRDQLMAEGLHFCSICKTIKEADAFPTSDKGRGGRSSRCRQCSSRKNKNRTTGYIAHGHRPEIAARWVENNRDKVREKDRRCYEKNKKPAEPRILLTPEQLRANARSSKRKNFDKRKALGMTGRQANYMATAPEFDESWNVIKR